MINTNQQNQPKKLMIIFAHAFVGWGLCAATMGIGMATLSLTNALLVHAIGAPIFFAAVSLVYFSRFNYTPPLQTALLFVGFVMAVDFFVVALWINRSLAMFSSLLGTWIPFALIFAATYLTGKWGQKEISNMKYGKLPVLFVTVVIGLTLFRGTSATSIGLGLSWEKHIFVQEYWQNGKARFAIANLRKEPATIEVYKLDTHTRLAGPWLVPALSIRYLDASKLQGSELISFTLTTGDKLGILRAPFASIKRGNGEVITVDGINGSGGKDDETWYEQPTMRFPAGKRFEIQLLTRSKSGTISYLQKQLYSYEVPELLLLDADCPTLPVQRKDKEILIKLGTPIHVQETHSITLHFQAPAVKRPTMYMINGWLDFGDGSGHGLARGIVIVPASP